MRRAPQEGQKPRRLHENATSFSWPHSLQRRRRNPCARIAAGEEGIELGFDKVRQGAATLGFDLRQEGFEVFLNQLIEDGFFGAPPLVMAWMGCRRALERWLHGRTRSTVRIRMLSARTISRKGGQGSFHGVSPVMWWLISTLDQTSGDLVHTRTVMRFVGRQGLSLLSH
jgi:hypothetical protein